MRVFARSLGFVSSIISMVLWAVMIFFNPYNPDIEFDVLFNTFITLFMPACLVLVGTTLNYSISIYLGFIFSLPISLYLLGTPGIFLLFGVTSFLYLCTAVLFSFQNHKKDKQERLRKT